MCTCQLYVALLKPFEDCKSAHSKKRKKARGTYRTMSGASALLACPASTYCACGDSTLISSLLSSTLSPYDIDRNNSTPNLQAECVGQAWPIRPLHSSGHRELRRPSEINSQDFCGAAAEKKPLFSPVVTQQNGSNPGAAVCRGSVGPNKEPENKAISGGKGLRCGERQTDDI